MGGVVTMKYYQKGNESVKKNIDKTRTNVPKTKDEYSTKITDIDKLHELLEERTCLSR